jgi:glutathione S-transferase
MPITLYDLAGADAERRFSPFCWRTKMALAHKGIEVETVPWRFTDKHKLPQPNAGRVPVIVDGGEVVHDSSAIAEYLETHYPDRPSLLGGETSRALTRFVQNWTETVLHPGMIGLRRTLERQKFVAGDAPAYADYLVFGALQWARAISDFELLAADDPIAAWRGRLLDLYGGLARKSPAYGG